MGLIQILLLEVHSVHRKINHMLTGHYDLSSLAHQQKIENDIICSDY
jgi:hypothetical protein